MQEKETGLAGLAPSEEFDAGPANLNGTSLRFLA